MMAGKFMPKKFVAASTCTRERLAATTAGCTVEANAASKADAVAVPWAAASSACIAAALSHDMYCVATVIIAAAEGPSQDPVVKSVVTVLNDATADASSSARPFQ